MPAAGEDAGRPKAHFASAPAAAAARKGSWMSQATAERTTGEQEFLPAHQQKGSLARIAAQQVLIRKALGSIAFRDEIMEAEWQTCARSSCSDLCRAQTLADVMRSLTDLAPVSRRALYRPRRHSRASYFSTLERTCANLCGVLLAMLLLMSSVTTYLWLTLDDPASPVDKDERDTSLRWAVALSVHWVISLCLNGMLQLRWHRRHVWPRSPISPPHAASPLVYATHVGFTLWFAFWLGTLTYLAFAAKRARADSLPDTPARASLLNEFSSATNSSTALIALVSLR